ncbi:MAG: hypothetical protein ABSA53_26250 [Streptosporangiaceae bacterium]
MGDVRGGHVTGHQRGDGDAATGPGQLFGEHHDGQRVARTAAVLFRHRQPEQAGAAHLLQQGRRRMAGRLGFVHHRTHVAIDETPHARPELLVVVVKFPAHGSGHG